VTKNAGPEGGRDGEPAPASTQPDDLINFEDNTDEYRPEAEAIARRLIKGRPASRQGVLPIVLGEFAHWFGDFAVRPPYSYEAVADEVWACWLERKIS
jgi:hypothetical protein